ncbi:MAG: bifunctional UDP-N-acetylglucosamine diphosphorylase/glucosamine-1-phosphate N-acetyltransferase GlmU [Pseudomonadota bacterium]
MTQLPLSAVILAAGKGTRMRSPLPKILHDIGNTPLLGHVLGLCQKAGINNKMIVTGHQAEAVQKAALELDDGCDFCIQEPQLGTAHAVSQAKEFLQKQEGDVVILYADTPLIHPETLKAMQKIRQAGYDMAFLGFESASPGGYGRLVMDDQGELHEIVEAKDATPEQLEIPYCNSGVMMVKAGILLGLLEQVDNKNAKEEYYLTDVVKIGRKMGLKVGVGLCHEDETIGVNAQAELAHAELIFQTHKRLEVMQMGVTLQMPQTVYFSYDTEIGAGTRIEPHVYFGPKVQIEEECYIKAFSHIEGAHIHKNAVIGPFARLRTGTMVQQDVKIGNFVETKNALIDQGVKINHLSYIGDASIGKETNIGAGTITCNYDGYEKHKTFIGSHAFIGSNSSLVAPVHIGDNAYIGSGSVITKNVTGGALALTRGPYKEVPGWSERLKKKKIS